MIFLFWIEKTVENLLQYSSCSSREVNSCFLINNVQLTPKLKLKELEDMV